MEIILRLFWEFFKTGLFAVGGGLATIPFLTEMAEKFGWFNLETLSTMIAVSESTPGPIGINMATYVGFTVNGVIGALVATLSLVLPSLIIICIIANFFKEFKENELVKRIFNGIKPAVIAFIIAAVSGLFISTFLNLHNDGSALAFINFKSLILMVVLLMVEHKYPKVHPILIILIAAIIAVIFKF